MAAQCGMKVYVAADSDGLFVDGAEVQVLRNVRLVAP